MSILNMTFDAYLAQRKADLLGNKKNRRILIGVEATRLARDELRMATLLTRAIAHDARRGSVRQKDDSVTIDEILKVNEVVAAYVPHAFNLLVWSGEIDPPPFFFNDTATTEIYTTGN